MRARTASNTAEAVRPLTSIASDSALKRRAAPVSQLRPGPQNQSRHWRRRRKRATPAARTPTAAETASIAIRNSGRRTGLLNAPPDATPNPPPIAARDAGQAAAASAAAATVWMTARSPMPPSAFKRPLRNTKTLARTIGRASHRAAPSAGGAIPAHRATACGAAIMSSATNAVAIANMHAAVRTNSRRGRPASALAPRTRAVCPLPVAATSAVCRSCCKVTSQATAAGPAATATVLMASAVRRPLASAAPPDLPIAESSACGRSGRRMARAGGRGAGGRRPEISCIVLMRQPSKTLPPGGRRPGRPRR